MDVRRLFEDPDGDQLTYSLPSSKDLADLESHGLTFNGLWGFYGNRPGIPGIIAMVKVRATDTQGEYAEMWVNFRI